MPAPPSRRLAARVVVAAAISLLLPLLPVPAVDFVPVASATVHPVPRMRAASPADLAAMEADEDLGGDRLVGTDRGLEEFAAIGATFTRAPSSPVLVRLLESDGSWTAWHELEANGEDGPDPGSPEAVASGDAVATEPLFVGSATGYELSVGADDVDDVAVALVREHERTVITDSVPFADASPGPPFIVRNRSAWVARPTSGLSTAPSVQFAVVHHTVSSNNYSAAQVPSILRSIQAYHMDANGWSDIGYNFLVDRFGGIWEGRGGGMTNAVIGAHAAGFNTSSVGVSLIGDYTKASPSAAALEATSKIIGWRLLSSAVDPAGRVQVTSRGSPTIPEGRVVDIPRVIGHRDVGATACPGSVYASLGAVRARASQLRRSYETLYDPVGRLDDVTVLGRELTIQGWSKDPDTDAPVVVHVSVNGRWLVLTANRARPDVGAAHPGFGGNRGFSVTTTVPPGATTVCAYGINQGRGTGNPLLGSCRSVVVK